MADWLQERDTAKGTQASNFQGEVGLSRMRRRILSFLGTFLFRRAWVLLPVLVVMTALAVWVIPGMNLDTGLEAFLPPGSPYEQQIRQIFGDHRNLEPVMIVIRTDQQGQKEELIRVAEVMAALLEDAQYFARPIYKVDEMAQSFYDSLSNERLILLLTQNDWDELKRLMSRRISNERLRKLRAHRLSACLPKAFSTNPSRDPLGALESIRDRLAYSRGPTRLHPGEDGYFLSEDERSITILMHPLAPAENARAVLGMMRSLEQSRDILLERNDRWRQLFEIEFLGSHAETAQHLRRIGAELAFILKITIPLALLLILVVFRKVEAILFVVVPPLMGLIWTLGLAAAIYGEISAVTGAFLLVTMAMGLHHSIHIYHRFTRELYQNRNYYRALNRSYIETGRGVLASGVVFAVLFGLLFFNSIRGVQNWDELIGLMIQVPGFGRLGLIAGMSILCFMVAVLTILPVLAAIKHLMARGRVKPVALYHFYLDRLYDPALANPRATLGIMLVVGLFFGYHARELGLYSRFVSISPFFFQAEPDGHDPSRNHVSFPEPGRPLIALVEGKTRQEALEQNDRLYEGLRQIAEQYNVLAYDSLRTILPSLRTQADSIEQLRQLDLAPLRRTIEQVTHQNGFKPIIYEAFLEALERFKQTASDPAYLRYSEGESDVFIENVKRYLVQDHDGMYYIATAIYPHAKGFDPAHLASFQAALSRGLTHLSLIGDPITERALSGIIKYNLALMILGSVAVILVALLLHFQNARMAMLTFIPVLFEVVCLTGAMALAGLKIHFFTVLAMPLLLSLAMDNALQLAQYYGDRQPCTVRFAIRSGARVVPLACGLMAILYGTLGLSTYPGLRHFGATILIGSLAVVLGSLMLLPALLCLFGRGQPLASALVVGEEPDTMAR